MLFKKFLCTESISAKLPIPYRRHRNHYYSLAQISADRETRKASLNSQVQTSKSFNLFVEGALEIKRKERVNNGWISLQT